jgi:hypothetical protein
MQLTTLLTFASATLTLAIPTSSPTKRHDSRNRVGWIFNKSDDRKPTGELFINENCFALPNGGDVMKLRRGYKCKFYQYVQWAQLSKTANVRGRLICE